MTSACLFWSKFNVWDADRSEVMKAQDWHIVRSNLQKNAVAFARVDMH
jgi:hypothetical protein